MTRLILCSALLLAACAEPQPVFKPVMVDMPVPVSCATPAITKPASILAGQTTLFDKTRAALIELDDRKAYEAQLEAALIACQ